MLRYVALDLLEEAPEEGGGGGEDDLVRVEGGAPATGQRHVGHVAAAEYLPGQLAELAAVGVGRPLQPHLVFGTFQGILHLC